MRCPNCSGDLNYIIHDNIRFIYCSNCKKEFNLMDGKLIENSKTTNKKPRKKRKSKQ
jgi:uncharacterized protein YbaR (Trm112 family)